MLKKILYFIAVICIVPFFIVGIILGTGFFVVFAIIFGLLKMIADFIPSKKEGKIFSNGQVISVEYKVVEDKPEYINNTKDNNHK